jgi:hypothetical protein
MARVRKVPLIKGNKRVVYHSGDPEVVQSLFCGECERLTQSATIQIGKTKADRENISRRVIIGRACANIEGHKDGKKYLWPSDDWIVPRF